MSDEIKNDYPANAQPFDEQSSSSSTDAQSFQDDLAIKEGKNRLQEATQKAADANQRAMDAEKIAKQAEEKKYIDSQTGLFNRDFFEKEIAQTFDPEKDDGNLGVVFIDLNFLKKTNDTYGHEAGDQLIKLTSEILKKVFRKGDILVHLENEDQSDNNENLSTKKEKPNNFASRIGGDEFVAICRNTAGNSNFKNNFIESISTRLQYELDLYNQNKKPNDLSLSFSFGVAVYNKETDSKKIESTQKRAETLMYQQKHALHAARE
jgi:GGDEF domain-containing protein